VKVVLEFDEDEERHEMLQAIHAVDYVVALEKIENEIRRHWKWGDYETGEARGLADEMHRFVCDILADLPEYE
jgi:hypothetical protein